MATLARAALLLAGLSTTARADAADDRILALPGYANASGQAMYSGCAFNAHNAAPARCARSCDPSDPNNQPYARLSTLIQQTST